MAYDAELAERVREELSGERDVVEKNMFGGRAFLIGGNMAVAANSKGGLMVRIDPTRAGELTADSRASRMIMNGRELDGWLHVEIGAGDGDLGEWVRHGVAYAASLPPK